MPISAIVTALEALAQLEPIAAQLVPIVKKALEGRELNDTDIARLEAAVAAIDAAVAAKVAGVA